MLTPRRATWMHIMIASRGTGGLLHCHIDCKNLEMATLWRFWSARLPGQETQPRTEKWARQHRRRCACGNRSCGFFELNPFFGDLAGLDIV